MKKYSSILVWMVAALAGSLVAACGSTSAKGEAFLTAGEQGYKAATPYTHAVAAAHAAHPAMHLQDYYKTFYQDRFGPAHLMADTAAVLRYLQQELATPDTGGLLFEPTGFGGRFVRVFCRAVDDGLCTPEELAFAFMASANHVVPWPRGGSWSEEWDTLQQSLLQMGIRPDGREADSAEIAQMLATYGDRAVSHSQAYRDAYAPHYRIVAQPLFDSLFLPRFRGDKVLIVFTDKVAGKQPVLQWIEAHEATLIYDYSTLGGVALRLPDHLSTRWAEQQLRQVEGVLSVEHDQTMTID